MLHFLLSTNPSFGFLWEVLYNAILYFRSSELDRTFDSIIRDVEEEMEDEDKAYWVIDNTFYQADIVDGQVDRTTSRPIDPFKMSSKDIMKMLFILDNLTEG